VTFYGAELCQSAQRNRPKFAIIAAKL